MKIILLTLIFIPFLSFAQEATTDFLPVVNTQLIISEKSLQLRVVSLSLANIKVNVLSSLKTQSFLVKGSPLLHESTFDLKLNRDESKKIRIEAWRDEQKLQFPQFYRAKSLSLSKAVTSKTNVAQSNISLLKFNKGQINYTDKVKKKIEGLISKSLTQGYLLKEDNLWLKAEFKLANKSYDALIKLKGDLPPHWSESNKSWKVKIPKISKQFNLTIAKDKYHTIQILAHELASKHHLTTQSYSLVEIEDLNLKAKGHALLDEGYSDVFFKDNMLPKSAIYQPNNQWLITISNAKHPFANNYFNPQGPHPFLFDCIYYAPIFQKMMSPEFCDYLKLIKKDPKTALQFKSDQEAMITWLALSTYFGDTHSFIHDNHLWYFNEAKKVYSPIPKDFIPLYPPFKKLDAYLSHAQLMHPLFHSILTDSKSRKLYTQRLKIFLSKEKPPLLEIPLQYLSGAEKSNWMKIQTGLKEWHAVILQSLKDETK